MFKQSIYTTYVNNLGSQNVLDVNEPVLIARPNDGPIGPKHVALCVLLMVIIDVLDGNINSLCETVSPRRRKWCSDFCLQQCVTF